MSVARFPESPIAKWVQFVVAVLIVPVLIWGFASYIDHEKRLTKIEANRFTASDAHRIYEILATKADSSNVPPPIVSDALERIVVLLDRIENRLDAIDSRVTKLEGKH